MTRGKKRVPESHDFFNQTTFRRDATDTKPRQTRIAFGTKEKITLWFSVHDV